MGQFIHISKNDKSIIWYVIIIIAITVIPFLFFFHGYPPSNRIEDWASFSTYLGLSLSLISIIFIFLTYRSQTNMSSVLQFESTFFQWFQLHRQMYNDLSIQIDNFANNTALKFIEKRKEKFSITDFQKAAKNERDRNVIRYYRNLYHMLKYIYLNPIIATYEQKKKYYDIIQAQMTDAELVTVLFLLLADENLEDKRVFKAISLLELADSAHLFKNFYYSKSKPNFMEFTSFMRETFPLTAERSFHFLVNNP